MPPGVQALRAVAPIKTWSLVVTALGDIGATPDTPVESADLAALFEAMGTKREALRVALHRLAKDDWVAALKSGRTSAYFLTPKGLSETDAVRAQIYDPGFADLDHWSCWMFDRAVPQLPARQVRLNALTVAVPSARPPQDAMDVTLTGDIPRWMVQACLPGALQAEMTALTKAASTQSAAARMLTLHHWRRIALRDGFWLLKSVRPHGPEAQCQSAVQALL